MILAERKRLLAKIARSNGHGASEARRALAHFREHSLVPYGSKRARFLRRTAERLSAKAIEKSSLKINNSRLNKTSK